MGRLDQSIALVTGGASGLGKAIAHRLKAEGCNVVISDVQIDLGPQIAAEGGFTFFEQDVRDEAHWVLTVRKIEERFGRLNVLVNNAGIIAPNGATSPENTALDLWKRIFAVNVEGVFLGCKTAIPAMKRAGKGSIINISSVAGLRATPSATAYGASKAAVRQLTKSVAQHCAEQKANIRCNSIHPGIIRTPLWDALAAEDARNRGLPVEEVIEEARAVTPMGDFTLAEDIAAAAAFLASDDARHITGAKIVVDGGIVNCDTYHIGRKDVGAADVKHPSN
jgi:NAD(P)-dependent dehydrogenase (short-subunit alcohol dehydrogenase family)